MRFFLDHDANDAVAHALRRHGHEAVVLRDVLAPETNDTSVFSKAQENGCVMITCNRNDYLQLAAQQAHRGLIILVRRHAVRTECTNVLRLIDAGASRPASTHSSVYD